ncbi:MAG TPA: surface-adhesin E family protein [Steroidobacteraceae bacterium]|jgi:hypothetical protein|nr:surface-adhesin E family protein [Steroidobacteraceae bacterium]
MDNYSSLAALALAAAALASTGSPVFAQTPDQEKAWAEDRARAAADAKATQERAVQERAARKTNPMGWVRTLDPMPSGGWEFRSVANDGSWAVYSSTHQLKRSGQIMTVWMRYEYAETQTADSGPYLSAVEKTQFECKKEETRNLLVVYYGANNIQGNQQTEENDAKTTPWNPIVPGTREESNFLWACGQARTAAR